MDTERVELTDEQELKIRRQAAEVVKRVVEGSLDPDATSQGLQALIAKPARDLAEERRKLFEEWYRGLGFHDLVVSKPAFSNRQIRDREKLGQALFYRPATTQVSYEAFMAAVGQGQHWTVVDVAERAKIGWEPAPQGYWFWAEVNRACPRLGMSWNNLTQAIKLLALEEYVVTWWAMKVQGTVLDLSTFTWLRTRYQVAEGQLGALRARERDGGVDVGRGGPEGLSFAYGCPGGRLAEVVQAVA